MSAGDIDAARLIKEKARELGFDAIGIVSPDGNSDMADRLFAFLEKRRHGDMDWMKTRAQERASPRRLWPEVKSIVMLGLNYGPADDPLDALERTNTGAVSVYAQNRDYHDVVKKRLKALGRWMTREFDCNIKVFVDTAPVMEKPLAMAAGLGWQGKHTNLVSRAYGSWLFLGAVFSTLALSADAPEADHCGQCRRCIDVCPTNAIPNAYELDARRCISYLTIELKGPIPVEFRRAIGNRIYGCDDCLAVCPWNKFASRAREAAFHARESLNAPPLSSLAALNDEAFRTLFSGSPIKRIGRDRFVRNVLIAIGNSGDDALIPTARAALDDSAPLVRGAAIWALKQLLSETDFNALAQRHSAKERLDSVHAEWRGDAP